MTALRNAARPRQPEAPAAADAPAAEPVHAAAAWREHDLMIRRFHNGGLAPAEIAVVLNSKGLKVRTWHVSETFVRNRLKTLGLAPNLSRQIYLQGQNRYRDR
jgi:hypothetical protein